MSYHKITGDFPSADGVHTIPYYICKMEGMNPKGIIHIIHGMSEYAQRYEETGIVSALTEGGYIVCASDHICHGGAVQDPSEYGNLPNTKTPIEDIRSLRAILRKKYRYLPYFMLGHSMGSFLLRYYMQLHPDEMDAVILSGTSGGGDPTTAGKLFSKLMCLLGQADKPAKMIRKIMDFSCNSKLKEPGERRNAWIVSDACAHLVPTERADYGFPFTYRGYATLFGLMQYVCDEETIAQTPRSLPILLLSGEDDPVGGMGNGIRNYRDRLYELGVDDLEMKLYPGARHEVLNEFCREQVFEDLLAWADAECEHIRKSKIWNPFG